MKNTYFADVKVSNKRAKFCDMCPTETAVIFQKSESEQFHVFTMCPCNGKKMRKIIILVSVEVC